jgi:methyltransferase (TIGR00027 family)
LGQERRLGPLGYDTPIVGLQAFFTGFWRLTRWNFALTKRIYGDQLNFIFAHQLRVDVLTYLQARTCWMDDVVEEFVRHADGDTNSNNPTANVVILGAGYDSRCDRSNLNLGERGVKTYEVDAAGTHRSKLRLLEKCNIFSNDTTHVAFDFVKQDWMDRMVDIGQLDVSLPTLLVWEGVCQFLPQEVVESTLQKVASKCAPGSCIAFDYFGPWSL